MPERQKTRPAAAIDAATGTIRIDGAGIAFTPTLTIDAFLSSTLGRSAKPVLGNDDIQYYGLHRCRLAGRSFGIGLIFRTGNEMLDTLLLRLSDADLRHQDRSIDPETARNAAHKRWLRRQLPGIHAAPDGARAFPWGTIEARWLPQNDEAMIVIGYGAPHAALGRTPAIP